MYKPPAKTTHLVQGSFQEASGLGALASVSWSGRHVGHGLRDLFVASTIAAIAINMEWCWI